MWCGVRVGVAAQAVQRTRQRLALGEGIGAQVVGVATQAVQQKGQKTVIAVGIGAQVGVAAQAVHKMMAELVEGGVQV